MKRILLFLPLLIAALAGGAIGAPVTVYVEPFQVAGSPEMVEMKKTLATLLSSRMSTPDLLAVEEKGGAQLVVSVSYLSLGKAFSIDAVARDREGKIVARSFEQGEGQDALLPALARLGGKLSYLLTGQQPPAAAPAYQAPAPTGAQAQAPAPVPGMIYAPPAAQAPEGIIVAKQQERQAGGIAASGRLKGAFNEVAAGSGDFSNLLVGTYNRLQLFGKLTDTAPKWETSFSDDMRILAVDSADLDGDGKGEFYVTIFYNDGLASQVWVQGDKGLTKAAERLPYYFRAITTATGKKVFAQEMGREDDFFGGVAEVSFDGRKVTTAKPLALPRRANVFNFNILTDSDGKRLFVVINEDGYLAVHAESGEELWKSSDKYGGSSTYFRRKDELQRIVSGEPWRWIFVEKPVTVTKEGDVIAVKNSGAFLLGNDRSYGKHAFYGLTWTGAMLEEKWRTAERQNYLADYEYDGETGNLLLLEVVKKEGAFNPGASSLMVRKTR